MILWMECEAVARLKQCWQLDEKIAIRGSCTCRLQVVKKRKTRVCQGCFWSISDILHVHSSLIWLLLMDTCLLCSKLFKRKRRNDYSPNSQQLKESTSDIHFLVWSDCNSNLGIGRWDNRKIDTRCSAWETFKVCKYVCYRCYIFHTYFTFYLKK